MTQFRARDALVTSKVVRCFVLGWGLIHAVNFIFIGVSCQTDRAVRCVLLEAELHLPRQMILCHPAGLVIASDMF